MSIITKLSNKINEKKFKKDINNLTCDILDQLSTISYKFGINTYSKEKAILKLEELYKYGLMQQSQLINKYKVNEKLVRACILNKVLKKILLKIQTLKTDLTV